MQPIHRLSVLSVVTLACGLAASEHWDARHHAVFPTTRIRPSEPVQVSSVDAQVRIHGQLATTTLTLRLTNRSAQRQEAVICIPLANGAQVTRIDLGGGSAALPGTLLPIDKARGVYRDIVSTMRDPALVEFVGTALLKSSVFPIDPGQTQSLAIAWEELLPATNERIDYFLPRSEHLANTIPWTVTAEISGLTAQDRIGAVFAPAQPLAEQRLSDGHVVVKVGGSAPALVSGPLRLSWMQPLRTATVFATPDRTGNGGTFLFLAPAPSATGARIPRDISVVIDRSGSMSGDKWRQTTAAVTQIINGMTAGEGLDLLLFNEGVDRFRPATQAIDEPLRREAEAWIAAARPMGGTNIHSALSEAFTAPVQAGRLPLVLLLTDGLPTIGETREDAITALIGADAGRRRVFTVGIGADVNAPLLDTLAANSRARHRPIAPGGDVEVAIADVMRSLGQPTLLDPQFSSSGGAVMDVLPRRMSDAFAGDQILVLGRYVKPVNAQADTRWTMTVRGVGGGGRALTLNADFNPAAASSQFAFVARLWAGRRIGECMRLIRALDTPTEQRQELVKTVVELSTSYGILTEYTAFLATEPGMAFANAGARPRADLQEKQDALTRGYVGKRSGSEALAYSGNGQRLESADSLMATCNAAFVDGQYKVTALSRAVQQTPGGALWQSGATWIDAELRSASTTASASSSAAPTRTIAFASADYFSLLDRLAASNRHSLLAQSGNILLRDGADTVLVLADAEK